MLDVIASAGKYMGIASYALACIDNIVEPSNVARQTNLIVVGCFGLLLFLTIRAESKA